MNAEPWVELARPLDHARRRAIQRVARWPFARAVWTVRERRIAARATLSVLLVAAASASAPMLLFALSPLVLGVPHVVSDLRYLVLRPRLARAWLAAVALFSAALITLRAAEMAAGPWPAFPFARVEIATAALWLLTAIHFGHRAATSPRRAAAAIAALLVIATSSAALAFPDAARLALAHVHNLVAVLLWLLLFKRRAGLRLALAPVPGIALVGAALLVHPPAGGPAFGLSLDGAAAMLAPGLTPALGRGVAALYVFLQGVHYAVWLGWIPEEAIRGESTLSFRMSVRSLIRDVGPTWLAVASACTLGLLAAACIALHPTRAFYLSTAAFHAHLELAALAYFTVRGLPPR